MGVKAATVVSTIISTLIFIALSVAYILPYWYKYEYEAMGRVFNDYGGLFQHCSQQVDNTYNCSITSFTPPRLPHLTTVITVGIGIILNLAAIICTALAACDKTSTTAAAVLSGLSGSLVLIGVVVMPSDYYGDADEDRRDQLGPLVNYLGVCYWVATGCNITQNLNCVVLSRIEYLNSVHPNDPEPEPEPERTDELPHFRVPDRY